MMTSYIKENEVSICVKPGPNMLLLLFSFSFRKRSLKYRATCNIPCALLHLLSFVLRNLDQVFRFKSIWMPFLHMIFGSILAGLPFLLVRPAWRVHICVDHGRRNVIRSSRRPDHGPGEIIPSQIGFLGKLRPEALVVLENFGRVVPRERLARGSHLEVGLHLLLLSTKAFLLVVRTFIVPTLPFFRRGTIRKCSSIEGSGARLSLRGKNVGDFEG